MLPPPPPQPAPNITRSLNKFDTIEIILIGNVMQPNHSLVIEWIFQLLRFECPFVAATAATVWWHCSDQVYLINVMNSFFSFVLSFAHFVPHLNTHKDFASLFNDISPTSIRNWISLLDGWQVDGSLDCQWLHFRLNSDHRVAIHLLKLRIWISNLNLKTWISVFPAISPFPPTMFTYALNCSASFFGFLFSISFTLLPIYREGV